MTLAIVKLDNDNGYLLLEGLLNEEVNTEYERRRR